MTEKTIALTMAAIAYSFISIGFVLQKKGINWIGWKGDKDKRYFGNLAMWFFGFLIMNLYGVPSAVALKSLQPHLVSAFAGWGIIVLVYLSAFFLKEKIYNSDYLYSFLIVIGIITVNLIEYGGAKPKIEVGSLGVLYFTVPFLIFLVALLIVKGEKTGNILYAVVAGTFAGIMVVSLKALVLIYEYKIIDYFNSVYLYIYIAGAVFSLIALQLSFKRGSVMITGQLQYSMIIIYPMLGSMFVFSRQINVLSLLPVLMIITGITGILKNR